MAKYRISAPDGSTFEVTAPDGASESDVMAYAQSQWKPKEASKPEPSYLDTVKGNVRSSADAMRDIAAGALRGAGSIGATLIRPFESGQENQQRRADMDAALQSLGADPSSFAYGGGKLGAEVAGTLGAGGGFAKVAGAVPGLLRVAPNLVNAIRTSGMMGGNMATRIAGGGLTGAGAAALINPDDATTGAVTGAALPPALKVAGKVGGAIGSGIKGVLTSDQERMARVIAESSGLSPDEAIAALRAQGPSAVGTRPTVPQILQAPAVSQMQRTAINAGDTSIIGREAEQNAQRLAALDRIAPTASTVNEAADNAGRAIQNFATSARANAATENGRLFDQVDPLNETRFLLPLDKFDQIQGKYLGRGTFGMGADANAAIRAAKDIGTLDLPAIDAAKAGKDLSLLAAVKKAGGINESRTGQLRGEVRGLREAGIGRVVYKRSGLSLEKMAERMHEAGYLPNEDPDTLINMLTHEGNTTFAGTRDSAFAAMADHAAGGVPGAETVPVPVSYQELKNLRSSIGNAAAKIEAKAGKNPEWAALSDMRAEIDSRLNKVAAGKGDPGELFPPETVAAWRKANEAYSATQDRFHRGPQASMFRAGGDANPSIQGAEIPPKFFNSGGSQVEDAQAFARLVGDNPDLMARLRSFATTQAAQQADRTGTLTAAKLGKWAANHSGAIENTFDPGQAAVLREIVKDVQRADSAATLGMAKGSNTAQNLQAAERAMASGLLDNRAVDLLARKIPLVRDFTAPMLDALRKGAKGSKAQKLGGLLSDPEDLAALLEKIRRPGLLDQFNAGAVPLLYRAAPALSTSR